MSDGQTWGEYKLLILNNIDKLTHDVAVLRDELGRVRQETGAEIAAARQQMSVEFARLNVKVGIAAMAGGAAVVTLVGYLINKLLAG